jgi:hypothetical protein
MKGVLLVELAVFHELKFFLNVPSVLRSRIVSPFTLGTLKSNLLYRTFLLTCHHRLPN